jgi:hypothetical protein
MAGMKKLQPHRVPASAEGVGDSMVEGNAF